MNRIQRLKAQIAELDQQIEAILENDQLTADQQTKHDALVTDRQAVVEQLKRAISDEESRTARAKEMADLDGRANVVLDESARRPTGVGRKTQATTGPEYAKVHTDGSGRVVGFFEPTDESVNIRFGEYADAQRRQSYRQIKKQNIAHLKSCGYQPWGEFRSLSDFIRDGLDHHERASFQNRVQKHYSAVLGMNESVGSEGGYTVMPEFASGIIDRIYQNALWSRTDNYSVSGNNMTFLVNAEISRANGSRHGGMRGYWVGEGASLTSSTPTLREVSLKLVKLGVLVYLTNELISDGGFALEQYIARKAAEEFNFMLGDAVINGPGTGQPLGVLNAPSLLSVAKETGQTAATIVTENIEKMYARFYAPNISGLYWYHNQDILPQLNTMTLGIGAAGVPTYLPPGGLSAAPYGTLVGRPIEPTEFNATLGTQGDLIAADLGQMLSISKGGVAQAVSMHVQFLTDQMAVRFLLRINAGPWESAAITPFKGNNTQSSFVTLDTRA